MMKELSKKIKKIGIIIGGILLIGYGFYFFGCGFLTVSEVSFQDYEFKPETYELTLYNVMLPSSLGYLRGYTSSQKDNKLFLTFYKCFGGINSSWGAKDSFTLILNPQIEELYLGDEKESYLFLKKNGENGERTRG